MADLNYPSISLPKIIGEVVTSVSTEMLATIQEYNPAVSKISYLYGNWKEVCNQLAKYDLNEDEKGKYFPLFILIEDVTIDRSNVSNVFGTATSVNLIICYKTKSNFTSAQREDKTFSPILRPLYHSFLKHLQKHRAVSLYSDRFISHIMTERKYWGMDEHTENALGYYIDAIDISALQIPLDWSYCNNIINANIS